MPLPHAEYQVIQCFLQSRRRPPDVEILDAAQGKLLAIDENLARVYLAVRGDVNAS
jgi:hypothetical protein